MERAICPSCGVVNVPAGNVCFDCCYKSPQDRQDAYETGETMLRSSLITLRDRFAMVALQGDLASESESWRTIDDRKQDGVWVNPDQTMIREQKIARNAYLMADTMIAARKLPESG